MVEKMVFGSCVSASRGLGDETAAGCGPGEPCRNRLGNRWQQGWSRFSSTSSSHAGHRVIACAAERSAVYRARSLFGTVGGEPVREVCAAAVLPVYRAIPAWSGTRLPDPVSRSSGRWVRGFCTAA